MTIDPFTPTPSPDEARKFSDAAEAAAYVRLIYETNTAYLRERFEEMAKGEAVDEKIWATYPYAAITTDEVLDIDTRRAYGFVHAAGRYSTTLTRPDIFESYYVEQFESLISSHNVPIEIGVSECPIPLHFAFNEGMHIEGKLDQKLIGLMRQRFDLPDLALMDDEIANSTCFFRPGDDKPLALFTAPRVDYSLHRLRHYTATDPKSFQKFVLFTNYQYYVDDFIRFGLELMEKSDDPATAEYRSQFTALVEPGGYTTYNDNLGSRPPEGRRLDKLSQMPAYHLIREDGCGVTLVNIGVGPSNARNISDHIAVLRPHAWLMLGHCAGLRQRQRLGDYVLAHAYVRDDHVLDDALPLWVPIPALAEVQTALESAVASVTGLTGYDLKSVMRTGTVASTDNRNWEISGYCKLVERFSQSRAVAMDMESAVIAANGFRLRVPYGVLLCVSDRPLHGELKLPGMAHDFYRQQVDRHLQIGIKAMEILQSHGSDRLHSRKLRSFADTAFR